VTAAWAYGIVRADIAGTRSEGCVAEIRRWAPSHGFALRGIEQVWSDTSFPLLIATLAESGIGALVVPELTHLGAWAAAVRSEADLWTLHPIHRWGRYPVQPLPQARLSSRNGAEG